MAGIHIGISGWRYAPWRGDFYPKGLTQKKELRFASRAVSSIEINGSFYSLQTPERYADWYEDTPEGFVFSIKGPRYITHIRRLNEVEKPLANFFASGIFQLKEKMGPILWQFPPSFKFDPELFESFLRQLPHDSEAALAIAKGCEPRMEGRSYLAIDRKRPMRHAVEIRHTSFVDPVFVDLLRKLKDGDGQYLWRPGITENAPDTILGHRIVTSEFMPGVSAANKSIAFGDFSYYWIADRQGRTFKRLNELYATTGCALPRGP